MVQCPGHAAKDMAGWFNDATSKPILFVSWQGFLAAFLWFNIGLIMFLAFCFLAWLYLVNFPNLVGWEPFNGNAIVTALLMLKTVIQGVFCYLFLCDFRKMARILKTKDTAPFLTLMCFICMMIAELAVLEIERHEKERKIAEVEVLDIQRHEKERRNQGVCDSCSTSCADTGDRRQPYLGRRGAGGRVGDIENGVSNAVLLKDSGEAESSRCLLARRNPDTSDVETVPNNSTNLSIEFPVR